jgi:hypothetical protein
MAEVGQIVCPDTNLSISRSKTGSIVSSCRIPPGVQEATVNKTGDIDGFAATARRTGALNCAFPERHLQFSASGSRIQPVTLAISRFSMQKPIFRFFVWRNGSPVSLWFPSS